MPFPGQALLKYDLNPLHLCPAWLKADSSKEQRRGLNLVGIALAFAFAFALKFAHFPRLDQPQPTVVLIVRRQRQGFGAATQLILSPLMPASVIEMFAYEVLASDNFPQ